MPWSSSVKADATAEALFDDGMRSFNDKRYTRAIDNFSKLRTDYPFSPQLTQADLKIADAYYLNQQFPEAISAFKEFQSMHPSNENMAFVTLRLGQAHFDQFTSTDRDQKNTEIAKGYFETVISNYPKSPQAAEAKEKLAKCVEYLAEHEFTAAYFYFQQEKYPAARDRFEEIVRKYKDTPTAVKSLFYLGESYRKEKNAIRAGLAYEALIQHYPETKYAAEAQTQMAQLEKEKHDPLALLLMRDRRPTAAPAPEVKEDPALAKLKDLNLIAKTDVVYEEPGGEKGLFRRVADKLNPFSSSDSEKKPEPKSDDVMETLAKRNQSQKQESNGILSALWPFGSKPKKEPIKGVDGTSGAVVAGVDEALIQKGVTGDSRQAALTPPPADLPKPQPTAPPTDTIAMLGSVDTNLQKRGANAFELPPPPPAAEAFKNGVAQAVVAKATAEADPSSSEVAVQTSNVLSAIDQKLQAKGVEPAKFETPPTAAEVEQNKKVRPQSVELEPKLALEKGPLFLNPGEVEQQQQLQVPTPAAKTQESSPPTVEAAQEPPSRLLVKGPVQAPPAAAAARIAENKRPSSDQDDESKGMFEQIRQDMESVSKALNPFRW
jgi:outer membrane protein assembly factor BamD